MKQFIFFFLKFFNRKLHVFKNIKILNYFTENDVFLKLQSLH